MDCIITAGGSVAEDDPLYVYTQGRPKSLIDLNGATMLEYVVRALRGSRHIEKIYVVGLAENDAQGLDLPPDITYIPDSGGLVSNLSTSLSRLLADNPTADTVLLSSADIPLLTTEVVDAYIDQCRPFDRIAYYNVVTQETIEQRFPHSGRTFVKLHKMAVAGGDMTLVQTRIMDTNRALWESIVRGRKHAWKLVRLVGLRPLLKFLFRRLSLEDVEEMATRMVGAPVRVINSPYPELAMDVDKPRQVELLRSLLGP